MNTTISIYLDDERPLPKWADGYTIVRSDREFKNLVQSVIDANQNIKAVSLDNDLGLESMTGYELLQWLVEQALDGRVDLSSTEMWFHSGNNVALDNMEVYWTSFKKNVLGQNPSEST